MIMDTKKVKTLLFLKSFMHFVNVISVNKETTVAPEQYLGVQLQRRRKSTFKFSKYLSASNSVLMSNDLKFEKLV